MKDLKNTIATTQQTAAAVATNDYPTWNVGCVYSRGQQVVTEGENGLPYRVATAHANGDDFEKNARMIAAAPQALHLLERIAEFAVHFASESAMQAGGGALMAEVEEILREVRGA